MRGDTEATRTAPRAGTGPRGHVQREALLRTMPEKAVPVRKRNRQYTVKVGAKDEQVPMVAICRWHQVSTERRPNLGGRRRSSRG